MILEDEPEAHDWTNLPHLPTSQSWHLLSHTSHTPLSESSPALVFHQTLLFVFPSVRMTGRRTFVLYMLGQCEMRAEYQKQTKGLASLCPRQLVPLEPLLTDPESGCRTHAHLCPRHRATRTMPGNFCFLRPVWTASSRCLLPGLKVRKESRQRAADCPF